MNARTLFFISILLIFISLNLNSKAQDFETGILSPRITNYEIEAKLIPDRKIINGKMILTWRNTTRDTLDELRFLTEMNAFKNTSSSYMLNSLDLLNAGSFSIADDNIWGWIEILKLTINKEDHSKRIRFIQPDDNNPNDQTVFTVKLKKKIKPSETETIEIEFLTKLPKLIDKTGYSLNYYQVSHWFPKIAVYEQAGEKAQWNCRQFLRDNASFCDFGVYKVSVNVPENFVVGAGGEEIKSFAVGDGTKSFVFLAKDVNDFAWVASPDFKVSERKYKNRITIKLLMQERRQEIIDKYFNRIVITLDYLEENIGTFPHNSITLADLPLSAFHEAGASFPQLITCTMPNSLPGGVRLTENIIASTLSEQYFKFIIVPDLQKNSWISTGLSSYYAAKTVESTCKAESSAFSLFGIETSISAIQRMNYVYSNPDFPKTENNTQDPNKSAVFFKTFENLITKSSLDEIFKTYYKKYRFSHPSSTHFIAIASDVLKNDTSELKPEIQTFIKQFTETGATCDFAVAEISNFILAGNAGFFDKKNTKRKVETENEDKIRSKVVVINNGEIIVPVEINIWFRNGQYIKKIWNGKNRIKDYVFEGNSPIVKVVIDPDQKIIADTDYLNNTKTIYKNNKGIYKYASKFLFWIQNIMQSVTFFA